MRYTSLGVGRITADSQLSHCHLPGPDRRFAPGQCRQRRADHAFIPCPATSLRRRT